MCLLGPGGGGRRTEVKRSQLICFQAACFEPRVGYLLRPLILVNAAVGARA